MISGAGRPCHLQNCISTWARKLDTQLNYQLLKEEKTMQTQTQLEKDRVAEQKIQLRGQFERREDLCSKE